MALSVPVVGRDAAILEHIGRYRLTLRDVLRDVFTIKHPGNVLQRLRAAGLITERRGLPGRLSYYQLTEAGAGEGIPLERTKPIGERALGYHLAVLGFCLFGPVRRTRLERYELEHLVGSDMPLVDQVAYCLDPAASRPRRLWRIYAPGPRTSPVRVVKALRAEMHALADRSAVLRAWMEHRRFAWTVAVDSAPRLLAIKKALGPSKLLETAHVDVLEVVSLRTIAATLARRA